MVVCWLNIGDALNSIVISRDKEKDKKDDPR